MDYELPPRSACRQKQLERLLVAQTHLLQASYAHLCQPACLGDCSVAAVYYYHSSAHTLTVFVPLPSSSLLPPEHTPTAVFIGYSKADVMETLPCRQQPISSKGH